MTSRKHSYQWQVGIHSGDDMDRSDVIKLISISRTQDNYGQWTETESSTQVYCQVDSITQSEFYEGGRNGLNPELRFTVFFADYNNEPIVEYKSQRYAIYRTYLRRNDMLELYCERKGGTNGTSEDNAGQTGGGSTQDP